MSRIVIELLGKTFGRLTIIEKLPPANAEKYCGPSWKCVCSCEDQTVVIINRCSQLTTGHTKSCGCLAIEAVSKRAVIRNAENREFEPKIASARSVYQHRYDDGNMTFEEFYTLTQLNCFYCNKPPENIRSMFKQNSPQSVKDNCKFTYSGLDRLNNDLPHDTNNCVPSCKECNLSKRNMHIDEFFRIIRNIATNTNRTIPNYTNIFLTQQHTINFTKFKNIRGQMRLSYPDIDFDTFGYDLFCFIVSQNCFYCNREPSNKRKDWKKNIILCNGLDRINQSLHHTLDNIVPCCKYCNWSKAKRSYAEFITWAERAHNHLSNTNTYYQPTLSC